MGKFLAKHPDHIRRAQRIDLFCKQVKRAITAICVDNDVSLSSIDYFIADFSAMLEFDDVEYNLNQLLDMLASEDFIADAYERYRLSI